MLKPRGQTGLDRSRPRDIPATIARYHSFRGPPSKQLPRYIIYHECLMLCLNHWFSWNAMQTFSGRTVQYYLWTFIPMWTVLRRQWLMWLCYKWWENYCESYAVKFNFVLILYFSIWPRPQPRPQARPRVSGLGLGVGLGLELLDLFNISVIK